MALIYPWHMCEGYGSYSLCEHECVLHIMYICLLAYTVLNLIKGSISP